MAYFKKWNLIFGWISFAIAALVYILTMEPTTSLWDCAEFIATSYKLEVGHPPGAPLFMMIARFFSMFAPSVEHVALMVNIMSSLCGGFTILFLFWTITHFGRKIYGDKITDLTKPQAWAVIGAGLIGALAYCFTDTQWFSAVEGEVYSMSSMFTALVFWAMLQWENVADEPRSNRWLILIAYLMGLSIGIHILNLLTIPALVFIYYFKKYPVTTGWGVVKATLATGAILVAINYIIIPYTIAIGASFDKIFVNSLGLPVNSGLTFFVLLLFALAAYGIYITHEKGKILWNTVILCTTVILLGYSSYASVVIRASANPPMNSNNPSNPYTLYSLLNRDQYGSRPLLYGQDYSTPAINIKYKTINYLGEDGKYKEVETFENYEFPNEMLHLFPRMWSSRDAHVQGYKSWGQVEGKQVRYGGETITVPTAGENMRFLFSYQMNFMYWRYFLWNFVGRQNDIQGNGDLLNGNWLSGINFIDNLYLGPQDDIPSEMADNKARNKYYFLPFILGLIGLIYQLGKDKRNFTIVMWLFVMTGLALVIYFNTTPYEPRERDYVYAGSFYAFCIWIGLGVLAIRDFIVKYAKKDNVAIAVGATVLCSCVPVILISQNWDDHNRSRRYVAHDIGYNYLESTIPNSIIMNNGDNDTFPLWYCQEVEDTRPDVRIMNMSYLSAEWYIDQMRIKSNDSDPVPFSLPQSKYYYKNEFLIINDRVDVPVSIQEVINFIKSDDRNTKQVYGDNLEDYIPTRNIYVPVNKENVLKSGIVAAKDAHLIEDSIVVRIKSGKTAIERSEMMLLDLLANFNWERPLYFTQPISLSNIDLLEYLQFDGFAYRLVPIKTPVQYGYYDYVIGRFDEEYVYPLLMEKFRYGNVQDPRVYADYFTQYNFRSAMTRNTFARMARALVEKGEKQEAVKVLDAAIEKMPFEQIRHDYSQTVPLIEAYYMADAFDKGNAVLESYMGILKEYLMYFLRFNDKKADLLADKADEYLYYLHDLYQIAKRYNQEEHIKEIEDIFSIYQLKLE